MYVLLVMHQVVRFCSVTSVGWPCKDCIIYWESSFLAPFSQFNVYSVAMLNPYIFSHLKYSLSLVLYYAYEHLNYVVFKILRKLA